MSINGWDGLAVDADKRKIREKYELFQEELNRYKKRPSKRQLKKAQASLDEFDFFRAEILSKYPTCESFSSANNKST